MSVIFSVIVILLFSNKNFLKLIVVNEKQNKSIFKLFFDFTICLAAFLVVGTIFQYIIYTFILEPLNLDIFLLITMIIVSVGLSILADYLLKKFDKETLVVFNKYQFSALSFVGFVFIMKISGTILASIILTLISVMAFFIVGIILITLSEIISPKLKLNDNLPIILILSSIILMVTSIL